MNTEDATWVADKFECLATERNAYMYSAIARRQLLQEAVYILETTDEHDVQEWLKKVRENLAKTSIEALKS